MSAVPLAIFSALSGKRYYSCASLREGNLSSCSNRKTHRAERIELAVWDPVSALLKDPERLRAGLDAMIREERGEPELQNERSGAQIFAR